MVIPSSVYGRAWTPRDAADVRRRMRRHRWAIRLLARNQDTRQQIEAGGYHIAALGLCDRYLSFCAGDEQTPSQGASPVMSQDMRVQRMVWRGFRWPWAGSGRLGGEG